MALAEVKIYSGEPEQSLGPLQAAMRLDPLYPPYTQFVHGLAEFGLERYDAAAELLQRALARNPEDFSPAAPLAALYVHLGQEDKAKAGAGDLPRRLARGEHRGVRHLLALRAQGRPRPHRRPAALARGSRALP